MKILFTAFTFIFLLCNAASAADILRVVCFKYPPNLVDDRLGAVSGAPKGAIAKVWESYIGPTAGLKIQWLGPVPFSRAMKMLESGEADAIQHLSRTPEREAKFIFSKKPIMWGRSGLLVLKSDPVAGITDLSMIGDRKIAIIGDGYLPPFLLNNRQRLNIEEIFGDAAGERVVRMVISRRVWAGYFTFPEVLQYYAADAKALDQVKVIPYPGSDVMEVTYAAMSRKTDPALIVRVDAAVSAVYGTYDYPVLVREILRQINK